MLSTRTSRDQNEVCTLYSIPQYRDSYPPVVVRVCFQVQLFQPSHAIYRVLVWPSVAREVPAMRRISRIHLDELYDILQTLQCSDNDCAVCPWADMVKVENVSALFGGESLGGYDVAEVGRHSVPLALAINCPTVWYLCKRNMVSLCRWRDVLRGSLGC
jgi:hypothetical protein